VAPPLTVDDEGVGDGPVDHDEGSLWSGRGRG
jgi:hypothetical protein